MAFENGQVDMLAIEIEMPGPVSSMAGFQDDIDQFAQRIEKIEEDIEKFFAGHGGGQHGDFETGFLVPVRLHAKCLPGHDWQIQRGADGIGEPEFAVLIFPQMIG